MALVGFSQSFKLESLSQDDDIDVDANGSNFSKEFLSQWREEDKVFKAKEYQRKLNAMEDPNDALDKIERDPNHVMALRKQLDDQRKKLGVFTDDEKLGI